MISTSKIIFGGYHWWSSDGTSISKEDSVVMNQQKRQIDKLKKHLFGKHPTSESIMRIKKYYSPNN